MSDKKKGSLLGKLVLFLFVAVIVGVPGHMVWFGQSKLDGKMPWAWETADWDAWKGTAKEQTTDLGNTLKDKWSDLRKAAQDKWAELSQKITNKTSQTEKLFVERGVVLAEMEELEKTLKPEDQRDEREKSIGYGITAFRNALQEWEASLQWTPEQAKGGIERAKKQLTLAVNNLTDAQKVNASDKVGHLQQEAEKYQKDFMERTATIQ